MAARVHPVDAAAAAASRPSKSSEVTFWHAQFQALREEGFLGTLALSSKPLELRERLKGIWTTLGVVSALWAGVVLPSVLSPTTTWSQLPNVSIATKAYVYLTMGAFGLSFTVVVMCTMLIFSIDVMPTEEYILKFVIRFQYISDLGVILFITSIVVMVLGCAAAMHDNYGWLPFVIISCYLAALLLFLGANFFNIHSFNSISIVQHRLSCKEHLVTQDNGSPSGPQTLPNVAVGGATDNTSPDLARRSRARLGA